MGLEGGNQRPWKAWKGRAVDPHDHGSLSGILALSHQGGTSASVHWREPHGARDDGCLECNSEQLSFCSNNNIKGRALEFQRLPPTFNTGLSGSCSSFWLRKCVWGAGQHRWAKKSWNIQGIKEPKSLIAILLKSFFPFFFTELMKLSFYNQLN